MTKHASIIPLIGGETIGTEQATGSPPQYMLSYTPFLSNDSHIINYYQQRNIEVPYHDLMSGDPTFSVKVDSLSSVCPCAGLSQLNLNAGSHNESNDWMTKTAEYALGVVQPRVYWGENAPGLMSNLGEGVRAKLLDVASKHGYTMSFYRTKSLLHGLPQVRNRSFFFFWKGKQAPKFNFFNTPYPSIEDLILSAKGNSQTEPMNKKIPSEDPYYAYILSEIAGGMTHREYVKSYGGMSVRSNDTVCIIESSPGHDYDRVAAWLRARGFEKEARRCETMDAKLKAGGSVMRRGTVLPKNYIGAFVGHYPTMLTHPVEDRYISYREGMTIMGLPDDFELLNPKRSVNHMCQNVPVQTARDMASEVQVCLESPGEREWHDGTVFTYNTSKKHDLHEAKSMASLSSFFGEAV